MGRFSYIMKWLLLEKPLKLLILLIVLFSVASWGSDMDKSALIELKASIQDPNGVLSSWNLSNSDHCSWEGISCDSGSRVIALNVTGGGNSLSCARISQFPLYGFGIRRSCLGNVKVLGTISASVAKLSELKILSLPFNELSGVIPSEIWGMQKLEVLDFEGNLISGSLPLEFDGLRNLKVLNMGFNEIIGGIPSSLSNCSKLQVMNLAGNQFNGSIPWFFGRFSDMRGLYLSFNLLTGPIPSGIADKCGKLEHLELSGNFLTNSIPKAIGKCRALKTFLLYSNLLEGAIPSELGGLNQLEVLDVSRNNFAGAIPPELGNCSKLSILVLSNLWEPLPNVSMEKCASTADDFNFYEGTIPAGITSIPSLKMLWAPRATLQGNFPSSWSSCSNLEMLNLGQNFYAGTISEGLQNCKGLYFLDLSSNKLTGEISEQIPVPCMTFLDVSGNYLSGSFPNFSYSACGPVQSIHGDFSKPNDAPAVYLSYFRYRSQTENSHFGQNDSFSVLHDFSSNNLTGLLQSMPIATERLGKQTVYAFLAGNNKLTGTFPGVLFDKCDQVRGIMVNVSSNGLSGEVPSNISTACESLILLDLSWNPLQGSIPSSLGQISSLQSLSLSGNNLDGPIPASLGHLYSLKVLELSSNSLTGEIPNEIVNLRNLTILLLNNNSLSGPIPPEMANISTLMQFNVSFNNLSGPVQMNMFKCNRFVANPSFHFSSFSSSASSPQDGRGPNGHNISPQNNGVKKASLSSTRIAGIVSGVGIVSVLALIVVFFYIRKWKPWSRVSGTSRKDVIVFIDIGVSLTFENVVRATGNFSASNCIGNGGFGATYKAIIEPGCVVAVKRLSVGRLLGVQQFDAEIRTLGRFHHPNLVTLVGYHASEKEMFLLYNYLPGGNLEKFIQERSTRACDWRTLHKISLDVAKALSYLHDQCVPRVLHRDVKPSNILLDEEYNAYLSDFGLARLLGTSETHATTGVKGTFGYVAPEYAMTSRVSGKADVYSYGVVLLELISSKKALDPSFSSYGNGFNIVTWASMLLAKRRAKEVFVKELWDSSPHDDLVEVVRMAVRCTDERLSDRPAMRDVVRQLKQLQPPS